MTGNTVQLFSNVFPLHVANCTSHCGGAGPPYCTKGLKRNKYHRLFLSEHPGPRSRPLRIGKALRDQVKRRSTFLPTGCNDLPILFILEIRWGAGPISTIRYANLRRNRRLDPGTSRPDTERELLQAAADLLPKKLLALKTYQLGCPSAAADCFLIWGQERLIQADSNFLVRRSKGTLKGRAGGPSRDHTYSHVPDAWRAGARRKQRTKKDGTDGSRKNTEKAKEIPWPCCCSVPSVSDCLPRNDNTLMGQLHSSCFYDLHHFGPPPLHKPKSKSSLKLTSFQLSFILPFVEGTSTHGL